MSDIAQAAPRHGAKIALLFYGCTAMVFLIILSAVRQWCSTDGVILGHFVKKIFFDSSWSCSARCFWGLFVASFRLCTVSTVPYRTVPHKTYHTVPHQNIFIVYHIKSYHALLIHTKPRSLIYLTPRTVSPVLFFIRRDVGGSGVGGKWSLGSFL